MVSKLRKGDMLGRRVKELSFYELNRMYKKGYSVERIARIFRVSISKIYTELEKTGIKPGAKTIDTSKKVCESCIYRGQLSGQYRCCNYILVEKQSRGCQARHCFRYKKGNQRKVEEEFE